MEIKEEKEKLKKLEEELQKPDFWQDKEKAQEVLKEIREIKARLSSLNKYDKGDAVITIYSGAGGEDAEDWAKILFEMYERFVLDKGWKASILHEHRNDTGGIKNITFEVSGKGVYGKLKGENGVHRLVRISPFSAKKLRHTSFTLVEVLPRLVEDVEIEIDPDDLNIDFARSSGPGGQNVNKRETAVRITHKPTSVSVRVDSERSQNRNRQLALELLKAKLYRIYKKYKKEELEKLKLNKGTEIEWGHQIRSYVFHPYKLVKDHRTEVETAEVEKVLEGELDEFIEAEKHLNE
jgi:peptide chain release factor 2